MANKGVLQEARKQVKEFVEKAADVIDEHLKYIKLCRTFGHEFAKGLNEKGLQAVNEKVISLKGTTVLPSFKTADEEVLEKNVTPYIREIYEELNDMTSQMDTKGKENKLLEIAEQAWKVREFLGDPKMTPWKTHSGDK